MLAVLGKQDTGVCPGVGAEMSSQFLLSGARSVFT